MQDVEPDDVREWSDPAVASAEFVAFHESALLGAVRVLEARAVPFLERLAVAPDAQGPGLCGRLFDRAEGAVRAAGDDRVRLGTFSDHPFLLDFYESRGYERFTTRASAGHAYDYVGYEKEPWGQPTRNETSSWAAEWVSDPIEITSTPVAA
jgi:GNAT superfamily N-acetyltransferase